MTVFFVVENMHVPIWLQYATLCHLTLLSMVVYMST